MHATADAFDQQATAVHLKKLVASYENLQRFYSEQILASARRMAEKMTCPMHPDVVGKSTDMCPKCGMELDQPVRIPLLSSGGGAPALHTVEASVLTETPLEVGREVTARLRLKHLLYQAPILITDLRVVHTERIHLLLIDSSLTDYHHLHPQPTRVHGEYAFSFTPRKPGPYRAWTDLRTTSTGFQEYAMADIPASATEEISRSDKKIKLQAQLEGLRYELILDKQKISVGEPVRMRLLIRNVNGKSFTELEPVMGTFAHLVAFNEDNKTVLHLHPKVSKLLAGTERGGPELEIHLYATEAGFYRLFAQVQIKGVSKFIPFGLYVGQ